jgi:ATP-GRASP peptide maturase of grasp-with-spasm system
MTKKMILIISNKNDQSTSEVIQWLVFNNASFIRINSGDILKLEKIQIQNSISPTFFVSTEEHEIVNLSQITAVWYRRGETIFGLPSMDFIVDTQLKNYLIKHLIKEKKILEEFFEYLLNSIPYIGTYRLNGLNKLIVLDEARKLGIEIPDTVIVSEKKYISNKRKLITKSISEVFTPELTHGSFITYTHGVKVNYLKDKFFPSLFQTHIDKEADIRTFFLQNKFYSMAILSQGHQQTKTDFRKYQSKNPNRCVSFKLPEVLENQLKNLMDKIGLQTASIDLIMTKKGKFIFLEANPIGQFSMTSIPCNYFLEREIALALIELSKCFSNEKKN